MDFPLFSRLCRDGQENHESNDSARRTSRSESPFPVSNAKQKFRNSIWRMITFFLGGEPSIQLRYEDILDFPLFSRLCRDGQENHESNDSARRTSRSESPFPVSNAKQKFRNSIWRMITFFLGGERSIQLSYRNLCHNIIKALRGKHKRNKEDLSTG